MQRLSLAFRLFFRILGDSAFAAKLESWLGSAPTTSAVASPEPSSERAALVLLATLQREGRLVDFLMEPLDGYSDAQIGAATRDVHRDCAATLRRLFAPQPLRSEEEGASIEVPEAYDPAAWKLAGSATGGASAAPSGGQPHRGTLRHPGWRASRCELPIWTGIDEAARVLAPAEVELG